MDEAAALAALRMVGLDATRATAIQGGWAFYTFTVDGVGDGDGGWIVRFARDDEIARAARRELALLPALAAHVSFAVPLPALRGTCGGLPFFGYRRIAGRGLRAGDASPAVLATIGRMLRELHDFPAGRAAELLDAAPAADAWRGHLERLRPVIHSSARPALDGALAARVGAGFDRLLAAVDGVEPRLVHNDLGLEHVLVDDGAAATGQVQGIIDFESAWLGDPVIDLVGIDLALGRGAVAAVAAAAGIDLDPGARERLWHYRWLASVHALIHGVRSGDRALVEHSRGQLVRRLDEPA